MTYRLLSEGYQWRPNPRPQKVWLRFGSGRGIDITQSVIINGRAALDGMAPTRMIKAVVLDNYPYPDTVLVMAAMMGFASELVAASVTRLWDHLDQFIGMPKSPENQRFSCLQIRVMSRIACPD